MLSTIKQVSKFEKTVLVNIWDKEEDQIIAFMRGDLMFVFNFNPIKSFVDYGLLAPEGKYTIILNTDAPCYGGHGIVDESVEHFTQPDDLYKKNKKGWLKIYIPVRTAFVLRKTD